MNVTVSIKIPKELLQRVEAKMRMDGYATISELIRQFLREYAKDVVVRREVE